MPTEDLIDFGRIDLSRTIAGPEELDRYREQRGRFRMLDGILSEDPETKVVVGFKDIRTDDWWAPDHIPGRPLFPGALMVECAAQLAAYDYIKRNGRDRDGKFVGFGGLDNTRFRGLVVPDCRLIFAARVVRERSTIFLYHAQGFVDEKLVFECDVRGVVV